MALAYFVLGLIFSVTISIAFENDKDAYKFMKEVCDATQYGKNQDGPCVEQLEKLILENNHKMSARATAENDKANENSQRFNSWNSRMKSVPIYETFEKLAYTCTKDMSSNGKTKFQRICDYVRQGGDGGYTDWIYMEKVSCVLGYDFNVDMIDPKVTGSFRHAFQECHKLSEHCKEYCDA